MEQLELDETGQLLACEQVIERGLQTFYAVGDALAHIRESRLYRAKYATFEEYCQDRWCSAAVRGAGKTLSPFSSNHCSQIRKLYGTGKWSQEKLAKKFRTDQSQISRVVNHVIHKAG